MNVELKDYKERKPRFWLRLVWSLVNATVFRILVGKQLHGVRNAILRLFGATLPHRTLIYSSCKIFAPWNLEVGKYSTIGPRTELYNKAKIVIGDNVVVSQGSFLCTASHDISQSLLPLICSPISIEDQAWVAADVFVGPGVTVGKGAVVGARSAVFKDVGPWEVFGGNPAKLLKTRELKSSPESQRDSQSESVSQKLKSEHE